MAAKDWDLKKTKREAKAIRAAGSEGISQQMQQMMKYWEEYRPKMHKELTNLKLLVDVAQIAEDKFLNESTRLMVDENVERSEANRQAASELMMDPEWNENDESPLEEELNWG